MNGRRIPRTMSGQVRAASELVGARTPNMSNEPSMIRVPTVMSARASNREVILPTIGIIIAVTSALGSIM